MNEILKKALKRLDQVPENLEEIATHKVTPHSDLRYQADNLRGIIEEIHEGLKVADTPDASTNIHGSGTGED